MAIIGIVGAVASGGRFVPPLTIARTGLGLSAGQFRITDANFAQYNYILGGSATRSSNTISLPNAPSGAASSGTVQAQAPKGVTTSGVVNVARTPYTFHNAYSYRTVCYSHWHSGQCASLGTESHYLGSPKNPTPTNYTDSEGEWWRIW